jgi:hypothetical protein
MRDFRRAAVVTGMGVCCHLGDDLEQIESALRRGRAAPFVRHPPAVDADGDRTDKTPFRPLAASIDPCYLRV